MPADGQVVGRAVAVDVVRAHVLAPPTESDAPLVMTWSTQWIRPSAPTVFSAAPTDPSGKIFM